MAHKLKGGEYATDVLVHIEGKKFEKGKFRRTEMFGKNVRLRKSTRTGMFAKRGTFVSAPIRAKFTFNEILPSWNITVPAECGFRIDLRLSNNGTSWSPWMYIGSEGEVRESKRDKKRTEYADIEVDIDYLLISSAAQYCRFRVMFFSSDGSATPLLHLFSISYTNSLENKKIWQRFGDTRDEITTPPRAIDLKVPFFSQLDAPEKVRGSTCCPTCATMVLHYFGRNIALNDVIAANYDTEYKIYGIWPKTAQTLWRYGLRSYVRRFRSFRQIYEMLEQGVPIIISIQAKEGEITSAARYKKTPGHILIIRGMDKKGNILVNDPYAKNTKEGCRAYTRKEIRNIWLDKGGVGIVVEPTIVQP